MKQIGLDYAHGTGHGVGYFLNVHEGPHAISKNNKIKFKEGMVVSNEPGYYEKNNFGIRIENLIYVKKQKLNQSFENLTMVPIDKQLINLKLLTANEKKWVNNYHKKVYKNIKEFMLKSEMKDLQKLVQLFKILFHSSSEIILIFKSLAWSIFLFVGLLSPTTK